MWTLCAEAWQLLARQSSGSHELQVNRLDIRRHPSSRFGAQRHSAKRVLNFGQRTSGPQSLLMPVYPCPWNVGVGHFGAHFSMIAMVE